MREEFMESFNLELGSSWWWYALVLIVLGLVSTWYYAVHQRSLQPRQRAVLTLLRWLGLASLVTALFVPVARFVSSRAEKPQVAVVVDNSASMRIRDARFDRCTLAQSVIDNINASFPHHAVLPFRTGRTAEQLPALVRDSLRFNDAATNLEAPFAVLSERHRENVQAVVLVTDGAYNSGGMPLYQALSLGKPVFCIGVGDTAVLKDVVLTSIVVNERGYKNVEMPVQVSVTADALEGLATLVLSDGAQEVGRTQLRLHAGQRLYRHVFSYIPTTEGVHKLTARIEPMEGEFTTRNNSRSEFVTILPNERTIVLIAGSPSPDVAFISTAINSDRSIRLRSFIQKFGSDFYGPAPTAADLRSAESIILVGFPIASSPDALVAMIADEARRGKPVFFIASPSIDPWKLSKLEPALPFTVERWGNAEMQVTPVVTDRASSHALLGTSDGQSSALEVWNGLPPIYRPEAFVSPKSQAEVLATIAIGSTRLDEPLLVARSSGGQRSIAVLGYGIYRWKLLSEGSERTRGKQPPAVFEQFVQNALRWLANDDASKNVRIRTTKRQYVSGEPIEFIADVHDEALQPIDDATVSVTVRSAQSTFELVLQPSGGGRYIASVPMLAGGDYSFRGNALRGKQLLGTDEGRFTVGEIMLEYQSIPMNATLLRTLAERTGGAFYEADHLDAQALWQRIEKLPNFQPRIVTESRTIAVWNSWVLLALAISAFALEWYLRKRYGVV